MPGASERSIVTTADSAVAIRPMAPEDLDAADRVMRLAFGAFLGLPDPERMFGDADMLRSRYATDPGGAFVATLDGEVVGAVYATRWGSYAFFGRCACSRSDGTGGSGSFC
jgi:hypothetical protein